MELYLIKICLFIKITWIVLLTYNCFFLAAIYEDKFISTDELLEYSLIPDLQTAQAHFVQTLNGLGAQLVGQLNAHQSSLVSDLEERAKQLNEDTESSS